MIDEVYHLISFFLCHVSARAVALQSVPARDEPALSISFFVPLPSAHTFIFLMRLFRFISSRTDIFHVIE